MRPDKETRVGNAVAVVVSAQCSIEGDLATIVQPGVSADGARRDDCSSARHGIARASDRDYRATGSEKQGQRSEDIRCWGQIADEKDFAAVIDPGGKRVAENTPTRCRVACVGDRD